LQQQGADNVDAHVRLGFEPDARRYHVARRSWTISASDRCADDEQPGKVDALRADGVLVSKRVPMAIEPNDHNRD